MSALRRTLIAAAFLVPALSCRSKPAPPDMRGVTVSVDSAVYHLQEPSPVWYAINVLVTLRNDSPRTIYLSQFCGGWSVRRAKGNAPLMLGSYACLASSFKFPKPISVPAGQRYSRAFHLTGSNSPDTRPRITIEDHTGSLVFAYSLADSTGRPIGAVESPPFLVVPPRPDDHAYALTRFEMTAFERNFATAANRRIRQEIDTLLADSWTLTRLDGSRVGKKAALAEMTKPRAPGVYREKRVVDSVSVVRLTADSAVVRAEIAQIVERVNRTDTTFLRVNDIVVRRGGRLKVVKSRESYRR